MEKQNGERPSMWITEELTPFCSMQHGVQEVYVAKRTAYQDMCIADIGPYNRALFLDGRIQTTVGDEYMYHEPIIHVPSLMHGAPQRVLVLGGADGGAAREALKWKSVKNVTVVDIDEQVVAACAEHLRPIMQGSFHDERSVLRIGDAQQFIDETSEKFDVIVGDLTDPVESGPSRCLFTTEFYASVRRCLSDEGVYVTQGGSISLAEEPRLFAKIGNTLAEIFENVVPFTSFVPTFGTPLGFFVARDRELDIDRDASTVDAALRDNVDGDLRMLDGVSFRGLFGVPRDVRRALEQEHTVLRTYDSSADSWTKKSSHRSNGVRRRA